MPRQELHSDQFKIEQNSDLVGDVDFKDRESPIIQVDRVLDKEYMDELAFNEEPVTIRIEPSSEKNAAMWAPIWVNGKGAEVLLNGKWVEFGHLPVGKVLVVKRKYVEVLIRSKKDSVQTEVIETPGQDPDNRIQRFTSASHSFSIIHDPNPLSAAWVAELRRRNY